MSFAFSAMIVLLPLLALLVGIPVYIGIYVYRDAQRRGMNALLWTLVAVLAPTFTGFILYLLVRGNHESLACPQCGTAVAPDYARCPGCGARLRYACPRCGRLAERDWTVCPYCGEPLPEDPPDVTPPQRFRDKGLGRVLAAAVLAPVLLALAVIALSVPGHTGGGSSSMTHISTAEYAEAAGLQEEVEALIASADRLDRAYVLRYAAQSIDAGYQEAQYLVYIPQMRGEDSVSFGRSSGLFGSTLTVEVEGRSGSGIGGGDGLIVLTSGGDKLPKLRVEYGGKRLNCVVTDVDYPLAVF